MVKKVNENVLLNKIEVTAEGNTAFKKYQFFYGEDGIYSFLKEIEETGSDGTKLNTTIFKYGEKPTDIQIETSNIVAGQYVDLFSGDYDGDGYSDILSSNKAYNATVNQYFNTDFKIYKRTANNNQLQNVFTEQLPQTSQIFQKQSYSTKFFNFMSNDCNGDGMDDVLLTDLTIPPSPGSSPTLNFVKLYYSDGGASFVQNNYSPVTLNTGYPIGTFNVIGQKFNYFIPGDFDGDGKSDFITCLSNGGGFKLHYWKPSTGVIEKEILDPSANNPYYSGYNIDDMDKIFVVDFNGDGKQELMTIKQGVCKIQNVKSTQGAQYAPYELETIYQSGFPTVWHEIYQGDFNGDGKTDLLTRSNGSWYRSYSDGLTFLTSSFTFNHPVDLAAQYPDKLLLADYNGDGKTDILHGYYVYSGGVPISSKLDVYYSNGNSFIQEQYNYPNVLGGVPSITLDLNGDGRSEFIDKGAYFNPFNIVYVKPNGTERLLEKITDGINYTTEYVYKPLTQTNNFYTKGTNTSIVNNLNAQYPLNNIQLPVYCVSQHKMPDGIGGIVTTNYKYEDAKMHRGGKGFIGFKKMISENAVMNVKTEQENEFNTIFYATALLKSTSFLLSTNALLEEVDYTNQFINVGNIRFFTKVNTIDNFNALANYHIITNNTFDSYGNIVTQNVNVNSLESITTTTQYGAFGTPVPAKPISIKVDKVRLGANPITKTSLFSYNAIGQITQESEFAGTAEEINVGKTYDIFGNNINSTTYISGHPYIYKNTSSYDSKGRYPVQINKYALPQLPSETITELFTYDPKWGTILSHKSSDCLTTNFTYDGWGRLINTILPTGVLITNAYNWSIGVNAIGYGSVTHPGKPDIYTTHNILGKTTKVEMESYGGQWTKQLTMYDARGNIKTQSNTYLPSENPLINTYTYDDYNRTISVANLFGTATNSYSYNNTELTVTSTSPSNLITKKTTDATGKVIQSEDNGGRLNFQYDSWGNQVSVKHSNQLLITNTYNQYGRQTSLNDKNAGLTSYIYNPLGQLITQTDANANVYTMQYDGLQRLKKELDLKVLQLTSISILQTVAVLK